MVKVQKEYNCGITGYTGTIGRRLIKNNNKIKFVCFKGDITKKKQVQNWVKSNKFNYLIHLAAIVPIREVNQNKLKAHRVNTIGTRNLVDAVLDNKQRIKWFFYASTSHVYSSSKKKIKENQKIKPISYYGKTKFKGEKELYKLKKNDIQVCIGRIFSTANNSQRKNYLVPDLKNKIKNSKSEIILENLNHYRDFISIGDISKIIGFFLINKTSGIINICSGKKTKLSNIAKIISKYYKKKIILKNNINPTYLIGNNSLLKKIYKKRISNNLEKMIFND